MGHHWKTADYLINNKEKQQTKTTNKQTNKHTNKQANKQKNKQTNKQTNKQLTAAIPLFAMRILVITRDPPSLLTSSSGEAAPWQQKIERRRKLEKGIRCNIEEICNCQQGRLGTWVKIMHLCVLHMSIDVTTPNRRRFSFLRNIFHCHAT